MRISIVPTMILISLIPLAGGIWLIVLMATNSIPGRNQYGPNPKGVGSDESSDEQLSALANDPSIIDAQLSAVLSNGSTRDTIIVIVVAWMLISRLIWVAIPLVMEDVFSSEGFYKTISTFTTVIWAFVPLALAFAVKDRSKQVALFILGGVILVIGIFEMVQRFNMDF